MGDQLARTEQQLGAIIRRTRNRAGLTQAQLGEKVQLRQATISRLEAGEPAVQLKTVLACLSALGLELVVRERTKGSVADIEEIF